MGKYNPKVLEQYKYSFLGIYIEDLHELQNGNIPTHFETHLGMVSEALSFFPKKERKKYEKVVEAGYRQVQYLRALNTVNALKDQEKSRKKTINDFLARDDFKKLN